MSQYDRTKPEKRLPKFEPLDETLSRVFENITARRGGPKYQVGLRLVDEGLYGIDQSWLVTLAARPGLGKTSLACQCALEWAKQGRKTAFISLEMTKETILERIFSIEREVDCNKLRLATYEEYITQEYSKFCASISKLPLRIVDDYCHSQDELTNLIDHLEFRPDILILDHIQEIRRSPECMRWSQWEVLTEYLRTLKELAMRYKIAVLALSQINREGHEKPTLATLKGAGGIEEISDAVLLMHRLEQPTREGHNYQISIAKFRYGPAGKFYDVYFKGDCMKFYDIKPIRIPDL